MEDPIDMAIQKLKETMHILGIDKPKETKKPIPFIEKGKGEIAIVPLTEADAEKIGITWKVYRIAYCYGKDLLKILKDIVVVDENLVEHRPEDDPNIVLQYVRDEQIMTNEMNNWFGLPVCPDKMIHLCGVCSMADVFLEMVEDWLRRRGKRLYDYLREEA
ncbi:MAG: hypothetical protein ASUL_09584 [Candidatus Aramenus sulfurataquae]|uniref:Uncharacterized protein n=1 Tax=Candidatus Aramenus sulfurataquae TaxID=1326980 RepID=W7KGX2_9CREN|nr:MAG: hypothetical protein ASUL_09584 [Candidatus Aramenus sulfurataquae]